MPRRLTAPRPMNRSIDGKTISHTLETVDVEAGKPSQNATEFKPKTFNTEDLDIPTFLRNRK
jgi:hypothetical protein